jgi:hypothetical protein
VEGEGGRFRRTHLVPMPTVDSLAELNTLLAGYDELDDARRIANRPQSVGHDFALEAAVLAPLPAEAFETGVTLSPRVDRYARVTVRQCRYSVPAKLIGRRVRVLLRATEVLVFDGARQVAAHPRATLRGAEVLNLDHYLEVLARKPGALPGATALAQARAAGSFTATHEAFWAAARTAADSDGAGTRVLIEVLLLHRRLPATAVIAGMRAALTLGVTNPELVTVEARRAATLATPTVDPASASSHAGTGAQPSRVLTLPERPTTASAALPTDERPLPTVTPYDQLLRRRDPADGPDRAVPHTPTPGEAVS